ncbi:MAG: hypothetical protein ACK56L_05805, partial [Pseudanabaena sp.]
PFSLISSVASSLCFGIKQKLFCPHNRQNSFCFFVAVQVLHRYLRHKTQKRMAAQSAAILFANSSL